MSLWKKFLFIFILLIIIFLSIYLHSKHYLDPYILSKILAGLGFWVVIIFILIGTFRVLLLIPHMTIVILSVLLFSHRPLMAFFLSLLTLFTSSSLLFFLADKFNVLKLKKNRSKIDKLIENLSKKFNKYGFWIIALWSLVPIFNNDLLVYGASVLKINYWKFIVLNTFFHSILYFIVIWSGNIALG